MNQILDYTPNGGGKTPNKGKGPSNINSDKVVRILAIFLIIFAICIIGIAIYSRVSHNKKAKPEVPEVSQTDAKITTQIDEEGGYISIKVSHDKVIKSITYSWNGSKAMEVQIDPNKSEWNFELKLPSNENSLLISVEDEEGHISTYNEKISSDLGEDIIAPTINIEKGTVDGKEMVIITAKDNEKIAFVTYRWNDEDEVKVEWDENQPDEKTIVINLEPPEGRNDLMVVAYDASEEQNSASAPQVVDGTNQPIIEYKKDENEDIVNVVVKDEYGLKELVVTINGQEEGNFDKETIESTGDSKNVNLPIELSRYSADTINIVVRATNIKGIGNEKPFNIEYKSNDDHDEGGDDENSNNPNIKIEYPDVSEAANNDKMIPFTVSYESELSKISLYVNGTYVKINNTEGQKNIEIKVKFDDDTIKPLLKVGDGQKNKIEVEVKAADGTSNTIITPEFTIDSI